MVKNTYRSLEYSERFKKKTGKNKSICFVSIRDALQEMRAQKQASKYVNILWYVQNRNKSWSNRNAKKKEKQKKNKQIKLNSYLELFTYQFCLPSWLVAQSAGAVEYTGCFSAEG